LGCGLAQQKGGGAFFTDCRPRKYPRSATTTVFGRFSNLRASNMNTLRDQKTRKSRKPGGESANFG
jgi:hypothetical protein